MSELIKRKDAINLVKRAMEEGLMPTYYLGLAPTIEPKHGEWIVYEGEWKDLDYYPPKCKCNQCGYEEDLYILNAKPTNFCPNCGAKMDKEKSDE